MIHTVVWRVGSEDALEFWRSRVGSVPFVEVPFDPPAWSPERRDWLLPAPIEIAPDGDGTHYTASARHWSEEDMTNHAVMGFNDGWGVVA